jgi:Leucine-rich repeat (LRR) protein
MSGDPPTTGTLAGQEEEEDTMMTGVPSIIEHDNRRSLIMTTQQEITDENDVESLDLPDSSRSNIINISGMTYIGEFTEEDITSDMFLEQVIPQLLESRWTILDCSNNKITQECGDYLAEVLSSTALRELNLGHNQLGDYGAMKIARTLPATQIERLFLDKNSLTDLFLIELAQVLELCKVKELYCSHNNIGDDGLLALCPVVRRLRVLDLFSNRLTDCSVLELCNALPSTMVELYLGDNFRVSDESVIPLADALIPTSVKILGLMRNSITDKGVKALIHYACKNRIPKEIYLDRNPISNPLLVDELERVITDEALARWYCMMWTLCSVRAITRIGSHSKFGVIPIELVRRIAQLSAVEQDIE